MGTVGVGTVSTDVLVVFAIVLLALVLFVTELLPIDVSALLVLVLLIVLEPWTQITPAEGVSGFSNPATLTVLAMLIISSGISRTGLVQLLGKQMTDFAGDSLFKQLAATIGVAGPVSGFVNNTPVVAVLVPVVSDLAHQGKVSPSKLLIPLSYASMLGGTLTLIGTSTNILASDVAARLGEANPELNLRAFTMFEFTGLGIIVLVTGSLYLLFVGHRLLPERVPPAEDYIEEYDIEEYLTEVVIEEGSPMIGHTVQEALAETGLDADVLKLGRGSRTSTEPFGQTLLQSGDRLTIRANQDTIQQLLERETLSFAGSPEAEEDIETDTAPEQTLIEVIIPRGSFLVGQTLTSARFRQQYDANVLAVRSRGRTIRERLDDVRIRVGDTLLLQASTESIDRLTRNQEFVVAHEPDKPEYRTEKIPLALAIVAGVVLVPALGLQPIVVSALAGVVAMAVGGVIHPNELYDAVEWNVIFLLAGVIPLGMALEQTGGADLLGSAIAASGEVLPALAVLWLFYIGTSLITAIVSNNASVVLMVPVAVETAVQIDANPFAFVLAVTFAASTAFLTPIGYQTNLFVYGPGGYTFGDYVRIGAPLQLLGSAVTTLGIAAFWGL
jgi:di/tricarboxylate transporter